MRAWAERTQGRRRRSRSTPAPPTCTGNSRRRYCARSSRGRPEGTRCRGRRRISGGPPWCPSSHGCPGTCAAPSRQSPAAALAPSCRGCCPMSRPLRRPARLLGGGAPAKRLRRLPLCSPDPNWRPLPARDLRSAFGASRFSAARRSARHTGRIPATAIPPRAGKREGSDPAQHKSRAPGPRPRYGRAPGRRRRGAAKAPHTRRSRGGGGVDRIRYSVGGVGGPQCASTSQDCQRWRCRAPTWQTPRHPGRAPGPEGGGAGQGAAAGASVGLRIVPHPSCGVDVPGVSWPSAAGLSPPPLHARQARRGAALFSYSADRSQ